MYIWNDGEMPDGLTSAEKLFQKHSSKPYNPKLANVFFKSGMIEAWGRGFDKIREACNSYAAPLPDYEISADGIMVLCKACDAYLQMMKPKPSCSGEQDAEQYMFRIIADFCKEPRTTKEIIEKFDFPSRAYLKRHYLDQMLSDGRLKMTISEKPTSKNQKYFTP